MALRVMASSSLSTCEVDHRLTLDTAESHHLLRVRRAKVGESVEVYDGAGNWAVADLAAASGKVATVELKSLLSLPKPTPALILAVALPKGKTLEGVIGHASELGVSAIQPLVTAHSEVRLQGERAAKRQARWQTLAVESLKQSGNPWLVEVREPVSVERALADLAAEGSLGLVGSLEDRAMSLADTLRQARAEADLQRVTAFVGPEGDFTAQEYEQLHEAGVLPITLGPHVLRVETACLTLAAQFRALWEV